MLDLIIFINSDGPNANPNFLKTTLSSIENTIGNVNYKYYFVFNAGQEKAVLNMVKGNLFKKEKILKIKRSAGSWAAEYNLFFDSCKDLTRYIVVAHDDLVIKTKNFFNTSMNLIKGKEDKIGWITFTCDHYYRNLGKPWSVSARIGFAKDKRKWPYAFECHKFTKAHMKQSQKYLHLLDMPQSGRLVKIHAPYSCFNMVSVESMKTIGPCEDWTLYTMLIDEDWGLSALKKNLQNIWIPDICYNHPIKEHAHRFLKEGHVGFIKKWGFDHSGNSPSPGKIEELKKEYKDTLIPWSAYYNSYEWQYL